MLQNIQKVVDSTDCVKDSWGYKKLEACIVVVTKLVCY
jgi:predicted transcriptional regulator